MKNRLEDWKKWYREGRRIKPTPGDVYINKNGGLYLCGEVWENDTPEPSFCARMTNCRNGWTFVAHGITQYQDGTIEWDYSAGGRFAEVPA